MKTLAASLLLSTASSLRIALEPHLAPSKPDNKNNHPVVGGIKERIDNYQQVQYYGSLLIGE